VKWFLHYSGLLTTFGGSQEVFAAGLAACGLGSLRLPSPQQKRREPPEAARDWAPE